MKAFDIFKNELYYWLDKFELSGFEIRLPEEETNSRAEVITEQVNQGVISVYFSKENTKDCDKDYIKRMAKHEAIHCLLAEYTYQAENRYSNEEEMIRLEEKLVNKLEKLI